MAKAKTAPQTEEREQAIFALWRNTAKTGTVYFSGKVNGKDAVGFYTKTNNAKAPVMKLYESSDDPKADRKEIAAFWLNNSRDGMKHYLSGTVDGQRVVGFINDKATEENKQPYLRFYASKKRDEAPEAAQQKIEEPEAAGSDLPF